ncbi:MAG: hypothetical protein GX417_00955 [Clostridiales bacterium]|nr:hypothetical protein [Clostridiales bacterium]
MWNGLKRIWDEVSATGETILRFIAIISPVICISGLIYMAGGDTQVTTLHWIWRVSALITGFDALFVIGYGIAKGVRRRKKNAALALLRQECCEKGHIWDGCICLRCGKKRDEGHDWKRVCLEGGCDTCPKKAGPGDWGMCMPETGELCSRDSVYEDRCRKCGAVRTTEP